MHAKKFKIKIIIRLFFFFFSNIKFRWVGLQRVIRIKQASILKSAYTLLIKEILTLTIELNSRLCEWVNFMPTESTLILLVIYIITQDRTKWHKVEQHIINFYGIEFFFVLHDFCWTKYYFGILNNLACTWDKRVFCDWVRDKNSSFCPVSYLQYVMSLKQFKK